MTMDRERLIDRIYEDAGGVSRQAELSALLSGAVLRGHNACNRSSARIDHRQGAPFDHGQRNLKASI